MSESTPTIMEGCKVSAESRNQLNSKLNDQLESLKTLKQELKENKTVRDTLLKEVTRLLTDESENDPSEIEGATQSTDAVDKLVGEWEAKVVEQQRIVGDSQKKVKEATKEVDKCFKQYKKAEKSKQKEYKKTLKKKSVIITLTEGLHNLTNINFDMVSGQMIDAPTNINISDIKNAFFLNKTQFLPTEKIILNHRINSLLNQIGTLGMKIKNDRENLSIEQLSQFSIEVSKNSKALGRIFKEINSILSEDTIPKIESGIESYIDRLKINQYGQYSVEQSRVLQKIRDLCYEKEVLKQKMGQAQADSFLQNNITKVLEANGFPTDNLNKILKILNQMDEKMVKILIKSGIEQEELVNVMLKIKQDYQLEIASEIPLSMMLSEDIREIVDLTKKEADKLGKKLDDLIENITIMLSKVLILHNHLL